MKTIKIIDLLNKIANGEIELGTKFIWHYKFEDIELIYTERYGAKGLYFVKEDADEVDVEDAEDEELRGLFEEYNYQILNDKIEEVKEDKGIKKISTDIPCAYEIETTLRDKLNEVIDAVNKLNKK